VRRVSESSAVEVHVCVLYTVKVCGLKMRELDHPNIKIHVNLKIHRGERQDATLQKGTTRHREQ